MTIKKLKDKVFTAYKIRIESIVIRTKEDGMVSHKIVGWIAHIDNGSTITSFRENNQRKLWKEIKKEVYL